MRFTFLAGSALVAVVLMAPCGADARPQHAKAAAPEPDRPAPVADLVKGIDIPFDAFTLKNGLRVVVHSDRRLKTVSVNVIYNVGSTAEPAGRSGFAHLFEHLMFEGSENAPGDYIVPLQKIGAQVNGMTNVDRTSYYDIVPTPGLEQALFLESDRMGWLLGALTQAKLDEQRAVVQNEKREGDNRPLAAVRERITTALYPAGHPYAHSIIGSMADLDAASLDDVRSWFRTHYGPNNAILAMAGDIDPKSARALAEKYFGAIPAGPARVAPIAPVPTLPRRIDDATTDRVSASTLYRAWAVPGTTDPAAAPLKIAAAVMGGMKSAFLKEQLIDREKLFTSIGSSLQLSAQAGMFAIEGTVRAGVDPALAGRRLDAAVAAFLSKGTNVEDLERYLTGVVATRLSVIESAGGKVNLLAEGIRLGRGPDFHRQELHDLVAQTPASVLATARHWLTRPVYALTVLNGPVPRYADATRPAVATPVADTAPVQGTRGPLPPLGTFADIVFPKVEHARLSNGVELVYLKGTAVPVTEMVIDFDAGRIADPLRARGTQALMLRLFDKGTARRAAPDVARLIERIGARMMIDAEADRTTARLWTPSANLSPALTLFAEMLRSPAFRAEEIETQRAGLLSDIADTLSRPGGTTERVLAELVDSGSPYARRQEPDDPTAVAALTRDDLLAFHRAWIRADKARIYVISDRPLAEIRALAEAVLGDWRGIGAAGVKDRPSAAASAPAQIVLIDTPGAPQSIVSAGHRTGLSGRDDMIAVELANVVLGNSFTSRLNSDLRERKGWSYGVEGRFETRVADAPYVIYAPVQQDRTGDAIAAIRRDIVEFMTSKPITPDEFREAVDNQVRSLSVGFDDAGAYLDAIRDSHLYGRPENYVATLGARYRALVPANVHDAMKRALDPTGLVWVVAGDAATVKPQLAPLGLPVTVVPAVAAP